MSDLLGDALARWDDNHPARPMTTFYYSQVVAAARSWHASRPVGWCAHHDAMYPWGDTKNCYAWHLSAGFYGSAEPCQWRESRVMVDALTDTAEPEETR